MKKHLLIIFSLFITCTSGFSQKVQKKNIKKGNAVVKAVLNKQKPSKQTIALRKSHDAFLKNSPLNNTLKLSKTERKSIGLPPNKYNENEWLLTMDPVTGMPNINGLKTIRENLINERSFSLATGRTPGDATDNQWIERGPNNVGGRTKAIMFDPNDPTYNTVFAGSVSGGLWKNTAISSSLSSWTRVNINQNLNVSCIISDPNNTQIFYLGTGESYTGDASGDGIWKSVNGGLTWSKVFGGVTGPTIAETTTNLIINSPSNIAGNYAGNPTTAFGPALTSITNQIVLVDDGSGAESTLGVNPLVNAAQINGKIALIRRGSPAAAPGTGTFILKITNAINAGAIAVIIMNNATGTFGIGGTDVGGVITIPSLAISQADGNILQAAVLAGTVNGTLIPSAAGQFNGNLVPGPQFVNEIKIRNVNGVSEIYAAIGDSGNSGASLGGRSIGLYKSTNNGVSFNEVSLPTLPTGNKYCPMDIEIASNNKIYVSTTNSTTFGVGGGAILTSSDGTNFSLKYQISGGKRTQIAVSKTNPDKVYVLLNSSVSEADLYLTTDGFNTLNQIPEPAGTNISVTDFTRGQAFYDLLLEVNPTNDAIVYVGGINLYKSLDSGSSWAEISEWTGVTNTVHSDQHGMAFKPNNPNVAIFGNDGGVYYCGNLSSASSSTASIMPRVNGLNVTQFYSVGTAPTGATGGNLVNDYFAAGAQDNGTQYFAGVTAASPLPSVRSQSGDGAYTLFDQGADKYYISNYVYNGDINLRFTDGTTRNINSEANDAENGAFICPMALDSSKDILYTDYSKGTTYQIRRYGSLKINTVTKTLQSNALLTSPPTALTVSKIASLSTSTLFVGTRNGKLLRIANPHGLTAPIWSDITGSGFVGSVSDIELGATDAEIFVTLKNYNVVNIWYSVDAGVTWLNKEGNFPDIPVNCILPNPLNANEVIVGSELGVWYTNTFNTASPIWYQSNNGMSNVKVTDLDLRNDNTVFAATYGRGIFSGIFTAAPLSTKDNSLISNAIKVYPTISKGEITITSSKNFGETKLNLFDITGKNVFSTSITLDNTELKINLGNLSSGNYFLKINGLDFTDTKKLIIE